MFWTCDCSVSKPFVFTQMSCQLRDSGNLSQKQYQKCCLTWVSYWLEKKVRVMQSVRQRCNTKLKNRSKRHIVKSNTMNSGKLQDCVCNVWYTRHIYVLKMQIQPLLTHVFSFPVQRDTKTEVVTMWEDKHYQKCYALYVWVHICNFLIHSTNL
jgi:hypothetical protein